MDYYGFTPESYELKFSSRGDAQLSQRVVELFNQVHFAFPFPFLHSPARYFYLTLELRCAAVTDRRISAPV
jgi:hypothetical protein